MASATVAELEEMTVWGTGERLERTTLNRERTARRAAPQPRTEGPFKKKLIEETKSTVFFSTDTFLKKYVPHLEKSTFKNLKYLIA